MQLKMIKATDQNAKLNVSDDLFVKKVNQPLIAQAIRVYLSNQRQSTSKTQTRSDVSRTSKKVYKQKGTGNARHGDKTANLFVGGGVAHGPTGNENWKRTLTANLKKKALRNVLTAQAKNIVVTDEILRSIGKTKEANQFLSKVGLADQKVLLVLPEALPLVIRSFRNIKNVFITKAKMLNVYEVAMADKILVTTKTLKVLEERLNKTPAKKAEAKSETKASEKAEAPKAKKVAKPATKAAKETVKKKTTTKKKSTK